MSTRFPALFASKKPQFHIASPLDRRFPLGLADVVFLGMILISVVGLTYEWLR